MALKGEGSLAEVMVAYNRHCLIRFNDADLTWQKCALRARVFNPAVGDVLRVKAEGAEGFVALECLPQRNKVSRSDGVKTRVLASNVSQLLLLIAPEPPTDLAFVSRAACLAQAEGIPFHILVNKSDLGQAHSLLWQALQPFVDLGMAMTPISCRDSLTLQRSLEPLLGGQRSVLMGPSGVGKSSLVNGLVEGARLPTQEVSTRLNSGRHTTTFAALYPLARFGAGSELIDTPGFSSFGLNHLSLRQVQAGFSEFSSWGPCRFHNCRHLEEPGCVVRPHSLPLRYAHYRAVVSEISSHY